MMRPCWGLAGTFSQAGKLVTAVLVSRNDARIEMSQFKRKKRYQKTSSKTPSAGFPLWRHSLLHTTHRYESPQEPQPWPAAAQSLGSTKKCLKWEAVPRMLFNASLLLQYDSWQCTLVPATNMCKPWPVVGLLALCFASWYVCINCCYSESHNFTVED